MSPHHILRVNGANTSCHWITRRVIGANTSCHWIILYVTGASTACLFLAIFSLFLVLKELQSFSCTCIRVVMNIGFTSIILNMIVKMLHVGGSAAKGLRTWVTMQERFLFSDIVIYFVAINCNCFFSVHLIVSIRCLQLDKAGVRPHILLL